MRALALSALLALCACGQPEPTGGIGYGSKIHHEGTIESVQVGGCTYVIAHQYYGPAIVHAGDCPNHQPATVTDSEETMVP